MKERFGGVARAPKTTARAVELPSTRTRRNTTFTKVTARRGRPPHVVGGLRSNAWKRPETGGGRPFETPGGADHGIYTASHKFVANRL